jgi:hypothetical protein
MPIERNGHSCALVKNTKTGADEIIVAGGSKTGRIDIRIDSLQDRDSPMLKNYS